MLPCLHTPSVLFSATQPQQQPRVRFRKYNQDPSNSQSTTVKTFFKYLTGASILSLVAFSVLENQDSALDIYMSPSQLSESESFYKPNDSFTVGGLVMYDSVKASNGNTQKTQVSFVISDLTHDVQVIYTGFLPPQFREGSGAICTGKLQRPPPEWYDRFKGILKYYDSLPEISPPSEDLDPEELVEYYDEAQPMAILYATTLMTKHDENYLPIQTASSIELHRQELEQAEHHRTKIEKASMWSEYEKRQSNQSQGDLMANKHAIRHQEDESSQISFRKPNPL